MSGGQIRGKIRKVTIGSDPFNGMAYPVDTIISGKKIVQIIQDLNYLSINQKEKILVIVENREKVRFIWKEFVGMPFTIEYGDPEASPVNNV